MNGISRIFAKGFFKALIFLIHALMALCGIAGCILDPPQPEYGMPHADYKIWGTVRSKQSAQVIPGISLTLRYAIDSMLISGPILSDSLGKFLFEFGDSPDRNTWILQAQDIDSASNGVYSALDTVISIPENELSAGDGKWYEGAAEKIVDIVLQNNLQ